MESNKASSTGDGDLSSPSKKVAKASKKSTVKESVSGGGRDSRTARKRKGGKESNSNSKSNSKKQEGDDDEDDDDDAIKSNAYGDDDFDDDEDDDDDDVGQVEPRSSQHPHSGSALGLFESMFMGGGGHRSAMGSRFKPLLDQMKSKDPTTQLLALQELSEVLSVATGELS
jgi:E3 ubiquitin-protein ligase TRIP12